MLPRPQGLHQVGVLVRTPRKKAIQKQAEAPTTTWLKSPTKSKLDGQPLEEYPYSSIVSGATVGYHN
jgi:hypothetical protein